MTSNSRFLDGRRALVTGGAGGIGRAISLELARNGAGIIIVGRDTAKGDETVEMIAAFGGSARFITMDLADPTALEKNLPALLDEETDVDILVNNAGVSGFTGPVAETPTSELLSVIQVNAVAPFVLSRLFLPGMTRRGFGRIVNISSVAARANVANSANYNMSKAALNSLTVSLSRELAAAGITVNALAPGLVLTDRIRNSRIPALAAASGRSESEVLEGMTSRTDSRRLTTEEELAGAVLFLCGDAARNITGEVIEMSGGF